LFLYPAGLEPRTFGPRSTSKIRLLSDSRPGCQIPLAKHLRKENVSEMSQGRSAAAAATEEHRNLHGREDKIGDLAAFESFGQFAGLDGRLQTVVKRVADFVEDFN
jgi:hypothetical protein